jgi:hypothetical protein
MRYPTVARGRPVCPGTTSEAEALTKLFNDDNTSPAFPAQRLAQKFRLPIEVAHVIAELAFGRAAQ